MKNYSITEDEALVEQAKEIEDKGYYDNICLMPDAHVGKGVCVGFTAHIKDKVVPSHIGVDIGCGMYALNLSKAARYARKPIENLDLARLDAIIRACVPSGKAHRAEYDTVFGIYGKYADSHKKNELSRLSDLSMKIYGDRARAFYSLGTLGGGNHFIEIDRDTSGDFWLVIHTGSRHLGVATCGYHTKRAEGGVVDKNALKQKIAEIKATYSGEKIAEEIAKAKSEIEAVRGKDYLDGADMQDYLNDMEVAQTYALVNREMIASVIIDALSFDYPCALLSSDAFHTTHNYIAGDRVVRKGAIALYEGKEAIIPLNMRDGILFVKGKGNSDWNDSGPHGAGRLMSRGEARKRLSVEDFGADMKGVWTSCVSADTIDEAPRAYKNAGEIEAALAPTASVIDHWATVYNFKASE